MKTLIDDIRSKYVGTADEHELLASLATNQREALARINDQHEEAMSIIRERASKVNDAAERLVGACPLDTQVYDWLNFPNEYSLETVAAAMLGRGLTSEKLKQVLKEVEAEETRRLEE